MKAERLGQVVSIGLCYVPSDHDALVFQCCKTERHGDSMASARESEIEARNAAPHMQLTDLKQFVALSSFIWTLNMSQCDVYSNDDESTAVELHEGAGDMAGLSSSRWQLRPSARARAGDLLQTD